MQDDLETLANRSIGAAIEVHKHLGPGLLESAYEECLALELGHLGIRFVRQQPLPLHYRGQTVDAAYRLDFVVAEQLVLELKSVERLEPIHVAQVLTYLRLARLKLGLLINFNVPLLRDGLKRVIL
ncbi:MAG: GxxExxY protein [Opitutales bacterium]